MARTWPPREWTRVYGAQFSGVSTSFYLFKSNEPRFGKNTNSLGKMIEAKDELSKDNSTE